MLVKDRTMLPMAVHLQNHGHRVGVLNPLDWNAINKNRGYAGMYWERAQAGWLYYDALRVQLLWDAGGVHPAFWATLPKKTRLPDALFAEALATDPELP